MAKDKVEVKASQIAKLGEALILLSKDIDRCTNFIKAIIARPLTPGSSAFAKELKQRFTDRMGELDKAVGDFQKALYYIGNKLKDLANVYEHTANLQKNDMERLQDLLKELDKYYPGASVNPDIQPPL